MTTTISLATRDSIVLGCDSLATTSRAMFDPRKIGDDYFDENGNIKVDANGQPLLKEVKQLYGYIERVPIDQLPNVTKLYNLKPLPIGVTFAGASAIGDWSIKNLIDTFVGCQEFKQLAAGDYSVEAVANAFFAFLKTKHETIYAEMAESYRPSLEVVLSGYSKANHQPEVFKLVVAAKPSCSRAFELGSYDIVYSGQYDVIQRVVQGIDMDGYLSLWDKCDRILDRYRSKIVSFLKEKSITVELPALDPNDQSLHLFHGDFGGVKGLNIKRSTLSEQASINLVEFLIDTMIKAQQFSGSIPTVGGDIHIAIITKAGGFRWVSKEEYLFRGHTVPKHG